MKKVTIFLVVIFFLVAVVGFFIYRWQIHLLSFGLKSFSSSAFICKICRPTKYIDTIYLLGYIPTNSVEYIKYKAPGFLSCNHEWKSGISSSHPDPVSDGYVVLVRENGKYGAFILHNQKTEPEQAEYDWWYQSD